MVVAAGVCVMALYAWWRYSVATPRTALVDPGTT